VPIHTNSLRLSIFMTCCSSIFMSILDLYLLSFVPLLMLLLNGILCLFLALSNVSNCFKPHDSNISILLQTCTHCDKCGILWRNVACLYMCVYNILITLLQNLHRPCSCPGTYLILICSISKQSCNSNVIKNLNFRRQFCFIKTK